IANCDFSFKKAIARRADLHPHRDKPTDDTRQRRDVIQVRVTAFLHYDITW
ncbi:unnamed protein product, partial [Mesorhabditis spiculigera]